MNLHTTIARTVAVGFAGLLLAGTAACSETNEAVDDTQKAANEAAEEIQDADVDWSKYGDDTKNKIEDYLAKDNCNGLNEELDKLDPGKDTDLTEFLKDAIDEANCA